MNASPNYDPVIKVVIHNDNRTVAPIFKRRDGLVLPAWLEIAPQASAVRPIEMHLSNSTVQLSPDNARFSVPANISRSDIELLHFNQALADTLTRMQKQPVGSIDYANEQNQAQNQISDALRHLIEVVTAPEFVKARFDFNELTRVGDLEYYADQLKTAGGEDRFIEGDIRAAVANHMEQLIQKACSDPDNVDAFLLDHLEETVDLLQDYCPLDGSDYSESVEQFKEQFDFKKHALR